jgi:hypothetical protein
MTTKKPKITTQQVRKVFKDLASKKNPKGGAAQPGVAIPGVGSMGDKSCGADGKSCSGKLSI